LGSKLRFVQDVSKINVTEQALFIGKTPFPYFKKSEQKIVILAFSTRII
jgi:hypothetical protein